MSMRIGQGSKMQFGVETTWGTPVSATNNITHKSESLKYSPDKKEEESLVGGRASRGMQTLASKVEGDIAILFKPDEIARLIAMALGSETDTTLEGSTLATRHTFEPMESGGDSAPKITIHVDRKVAVARYTSCKIGTLKISAQAGGFLEGSLGIVGYDEDFSGAIQSGVAASVLKAWRFVDAAVSVGGTDFGAIVKGFDIEIDNSLESDLYTLASGTKQSEIEFQGLKVSVSLSLLYETEGQALHASQFKSDTAVALILTLTSPEAIESGSYYELKITLPVAQISESTMNLSSAGRIEQSMKFTGLEDESNSAVIIEVVDGETDAYLS